jgi:hypothetical protein
MPVFLDPTGHTNYGIGVCDRCKMKRYLDELRSDPNYPGLRVCGATIQDGCRDQFDPWRLPARQTENITLPYVRPDRGLQGTQIPVLQILAFRLVDELGRAILTEMGQYIDLEFPIVPYGMGPHNPIQS